MAELARIAAASIGASLCVEIRKVPEGNSNKTFLLIMNDGNEVIAKIPNPDAGRAHLTTASEVATMDFVRNSSLLCPAKKYSIGLQPTPSCSKRWAPTQWALAIVVLDVSHILRIPAPKVFAWSSRREQNAANAEYIVKEKVPGIVLEKMWEDIIGRQKYEIVKQLVGIEKTFTATNFTSFGSLYYAEDVPKVSGNKILCVHEDGTEMQCSPFAIGPTNNRMFFDEGRGTVYVDRGPWRTIEDYAIATARREIACIMALQEFPRPHGLFYGPGQYRPTPNPKLSALTNFMKVAKHLLPKEESSFRASVMWHSDLHANNIFVNPERPTEIVARHPALIDFNGPIPEGLGHIELPENFDELSAGEQKEAKVLRSAQSLYKLYEVELRQQNKNIFRALQYRETLAYKITALAGSLFSDSEPIVNGMLMAVEREWLNIVGPGSDGRPSVPYPLVFSAQEKTLRSEHEALWIRGVELMEAVFEHLGVYRGWDGWVNHASYELMKARLESCLEHFLDRETTNKTQRAEWIKAWPFAEQQPPHTRMRRYTPPPQPQIQLSEGTARASE